MPDAEKSIKFQSELSESLVDYDRNVKWIMKVQKEFECVTQQENINITKEDVFTHLRKMPNWKMPGPDGLHEFWMKKFTSLTWAMVKHLDDCIQQWMFPIGWQKVGQSLYRKMQERGMLLEIRDQQPAGNFFENY